MILFVFEGMRREPQLYNTIRELFFKDIVLDDVVFSYCSNIYSLYSQMKSLDVFGQNDSDIIRLLKMEAEKHPESQNTLEQFEDSDSFSEIYLFFDYDIKKPDEKNFESVEMQNRHIQEMLDFFNDETANGKLYINYPMVESIRYFKNSLPDNDFYTYATDLFIGKKFKQIADTESVYKNLNFIIARPKQTESEKLGVKGNWRIIKELSIKKANYICSKINEIPTHKSDVSQYSIFTGQLKNYVCQNQIAILNSFPLFLYEYFK